MEGFVRSRMTTWMHIFKMSVRPGGEIPLDTLYDIYGTKYDIKETDFVQWLKDVKLKDSNKWTIVEHDSEATSGVMSLATALGDEATFETNAKGEVVARQVSVGDVVSLSVRKARDLIPKIMDVNLLKYALNEARPRPNKESLCRILEKRISELGLST